MGPERVVALTWRRDAADIDAVARSRDGRIVFSFSSDAEPADKLCCDDVERSMSDDAIVASFAWCINSVPDIDDGRRFVVVVVGGDLTPVRPSAEEVDVTRA